MNNNKIIVIILGILLGINIQAQSLKVMTYNIRLDVASDGENAWPFRKDFFASQINFHEPDVLGVQEAMPHQVVDLEKLLSQYSQVGIGREGAGKGESSNIFYKKNKLVGYYEFCKECGGNRTSKESLSPSTTVQT